MPEPVRTEGGGEIRGQARPLPGAIAEAMRPHTVTEQCLPGFEWRLAEPNDRVCAPPEARSRVAAENQLSLSRTIASAGPYGRHTCTAGHVWRLAFENDVACVPRESREAALAENRYHFRRAR
jgi:hypothetical protein